MPTRSARLASAHPAAATDTTLFTVPAGMTYLVKSVIVTNVVGGADTIGVRAVDGANISGWIYQAQGLAGGARTEWNGWVAMNPGDSFHVSSQLGNSDFWIGGAKLFGVA